MNRFLRFATFFLIIISVLIGSPCARSSSPPETITKKEKNIILLMNAMENPNYDIVLVVDISDSMKTVLDEWKRMAEKTIDLAQFGDTLLLVRFDAHTRQPIIQDLVVERDKDFFKSNVRKTRTTSLKENYGTDLRMAYYTTLKTLKEFNDGRKQKGESIRIQQIIFISDGDDLPPDTSPFKNPGSTESLELNDLIRDAQQSMRIRVLPQGMEFKNYVPVIRTITKEGSTPGNEKISKELKSFMDKLQDEFSRTYGQEIKDDSERVPKAEYEFYITGLSNGLELRQDGELSPLKSYALQVPCMVLSKFKKVRIQDMNIDTEYKGSGEGSIKKSTRFSPSSLSPGACTKFTCPLEFPRNWSFSTKDYQGALDVVIRGNMAIDIEVSGQTPDAAKKKLMYTYPFIQKRLSIPLSGKLPPAPEFLALVIGGSLAFLGFLGFFIYKNALPISITLSTEGKARAYQVSNGQTITVGGTADFEMEGMDEVVATVKREGRQFVVIPQKEGVFADGTRQGTPVPLKFGQGFNLNIDGTYYSVQFLEGDQEASLQVEEQIPQDVITTGEEGEGKFNF